jgi:hypothetical protein
LNFDDLAELQGIYVDIGDTLQTVPGGIVGNGELFNGADDIAIPYFKNNEFSEFTLSLCFNRDPNSPNGEEGLVFNGNDAASGCFPATITILSTGSVVSAGILTDNTSASIVHSGSVSCRLSTSLTHTQLTGIPLPILLRATFIKADVTVGRTRCQMGLKDVMVSGAASLSTNLNSDIAAGSFVRIFHTLLKTEKLTNLQ